jgi:hypothetical protein
MVGRWIHAGLTNCTSLPEGWYDEIVVHTFRKNKNGSISVEATVNVYATEGKRIWGRDDVKIRLPKKR